MTTLTHIETLKITETDDDRINDAIEIMQDDGWSFSHLHTQPDTTNEGNFFVYFVFLVFTKGKRGVSQIQNGGINNSQSIS